MSLPQNAVQYIKKSYHHGSDEQQDRQSDEALSLVCLHLRQWLLKPSTRIYIALGMPCCYAMDYEILFLVPMWPWLLTWELFCSLKKDVLPQSHDATGRIIFRIKIKVNMCTPVFEISSHNWLNLFATRDLNSRLNITDESYNPGNDITITRHVPSVNFWIAKHGNPAMPWSNVHHNKRKVTQWLTANSPLSMDPEIPLPCSRYSGLRPYPQSENSICPLSPWRSQIH